MRSYIVEMPICWEIGRGGFKTCPYGIYID